MLMNDVIQWGRHSLMRRGSSWASMIRVDRYCSYFPCAFCDELLRDAKKNQQIRKEHDVGNLWVLSFLAKRAEMDFFLPYYRGLWGWLTLKSIFYTNSSKKMHNTVDTNQIPLDLCLHEKKIAFFLNKNPLVWLFLPTVHGRTAKETNSTLHRETLSHLNI